MQTEPTVPYGYCQCGCGQKANIAKATVPKWGWVKGEPRKYLRGHHGIKPGPDWLVDENGCWIWQKTTGTYGYGLAPQLRDRPRQQAHRYVWEKERGPIPPGMVLNHLCRVPACVNPDHLEVVTQARNARHGRATKLTWEAVEEIRTPGAGLREMAEKYGVSIGTISAVRTGKSWREDAAAHRLPGTFTLTQIASALERVGVAASDRDAVVIALRQSARR